MSNGQEVILDLGEAIRDTIDTYVTGHEIPVESVVGLLHCIAHEIMVDHEYNVMTCLEEEEEEDTDDDF